MKRSAFVKTSRRPLKTLQTARPVKRSQLIENDASKQMDLFQAWLLYIGASPKTGLPASQIGMYTDFN